MDATGERDMWNYIKFVTQDGNYVIDTHEDEKHWVLKDSQGVILGYFPDIHEAIMVGYSAASCRVLARED